MANDEVFPARIFALSAHPVSILLLCSVTKSLACKLWTSPHHLIFRSVSLISTLSLMTTSLVEVFYSAAIITSPRFRWTPRETLIGDVFVRVGVAALTSCRLYRYQLICPPQRKPWVVGSLVFVLALLSASLAITIQSRIMQLGYNCPNPCLQPSPAPLSVIRRWENITSFIVFVTVQLCNMAIDYQFFVVISNNLPARRIRKQANLTRQTVGIAFVPSAVADVAYLVSVVFTLSLNSPNLERKWRLSQFLTITLLRLAPSIEAFVFFRFTMPRTHQFIRGDKRRPPSARAVPSCPSTPPLQSSGNASTQQVTVELSTTNTQGTGIDSGFPYRYFSRGTSTLPRHVAATFAINSRAAAVAISRPHQIPVDTLPSEIPGRQSISCTALGHTDSMHSTSTEVASVQTVQMKRPYPAHYA